MLSRTKCIESTSVKCAIQYFSLFFTTEFIVEPSRQFALDWYAYRRNYQRTREEYKEWLDFDKCEKFMGE